MSRRLEIRISISKLSDYSREFDSSMDEDTLSLIIESFSKYIRVLYGRMIEESINSRRYEGNWEPIEDEEYLKYIDTNPSTNILELISEALEVQKIGNYYIVRFNPLYKYPGSSLSLLKVLRAIEYGTSKFNSRPILVKIVKDINENLMDLYRGYLMMKGVS